VSKKQQATDPTGTHAFKYDPLGRRIQKSGPLGTTNYLYDGTGLGANVIEEVDSNGNVLARYTQGLGTDEPLSMLRAGTTSYYNADALGAITSLSNSSAAIANTYTYDSFGELSASTGTLTNPFQYTGRDYDVETGVRYYRARYYDQAVGRFLSEDPVRSSVRTKPYKYVSNNPLIFSDPLGLTETCVLLGTYQLTPWISYKTESVPVPNTWEFVKSYESGGPDWGMPAAILNCVWQHRVATTTWSKALFLLKWQCTDDSCPPHRRIKYGFDWRTREQVTTEEVPFTRQVFPWAANDSGEVDDVYCEKYYRP
jgi:RHS repeat-associated protein